MHEGAVPLFIRRWQQLHGVNHLGQGDIGARLRTAGTGKGRGCTMIGLVCERASHVPVKSHLLMQMLEVHGEINHAEHYLLFKSCMRPAHDLYLYLVACALFPS